MDVSAIQAFNPNRINWRSLTAKQILKYEKQGVEVPNVYLQWANNFLENVNKYDNDEITYENAKSGERHSKTKNTNNTDNTDDKTSLNKSPKTGSAKNDDKKDESTDAQISLPESPEGSIQTNTSEDSTSEEDTPMTAAQKKRQEMMVNGTSLKDQALSFTSDSNQTSQEANLTTEIMNTIKASSESEIQTLESEMKSLLAEADALQKELKQEVANINNNKSDSSTFAKIEQLQKELEQYGKTGQSASAETEGVLSDYSKEIDGGTEVFSNAADFGAETVTVGNELIENTGASNMTEYILNVRIGRQAVTSGNTSINSAKNGEAAQNDAKMTNSESLAGVNSIEREIEQKTGVGALTKKDNENSEEGKKDPVTGKDNESQKDVKTSQNDGTDTTDKLNISLDELVKRKVRKGDYAKEG